MKKLYRYVSILAIAFVSCAKPASPYSTNEMIIHHIPFGLNTYVGTTQDTFESSTQVSLVLEDVNKINMIMQFMTNLPNQRAGRIQFNPSVIRCLIKVDNKTYFIDQSGNVNLDNKAFFKVSPRKFEAVLEDCGIPSSPYVAPE